tara:strand:+ start:72 stop:1058 length:987 start_codon:yes stop_codon:yes gene_type:complete
MLNIIEATLNEVKLGEPQHYRNMSVFPLLFSGKSKLEYTMLRKALKQEHIMITEISENGSVPELKLFNMSESYILLLDGEELEGAKQNRVLNTTLLVYPKSELKVPVSCTEQGRWNRVSAAFQHSGKFLFRRARGNKMSSVHQSLKYGQGYQSNQSEVWNDISQLQSIRSIHSPTSAMKDIYDKEKGNLDDFLKAFPLIEGQCGIIVGLGGQVVGLEYLSSSDRYLDVHRQLIESYTMDALVENLSGENPELTLEESQRFLEQIWSASQETFRSAAAGTDVRLESEHLVGSGLVEGEELIHLSAFARQTTGQQYSPRMASYRHRRRSQ